MFERFTERARHVVVLAQEEARRLNHNYIGTEHLLLGLLGETRGVAEQALASAGVTLDDARARVEAAVGRGKKAPNGHIPFTPRAKKILELALREALRMGHNYIGTEHILLGLMREGDGLGARVLADLHVDLAALRATIVELVPAGTDRPPRWARLLRSRTTLADEGVRTTGAADVSLEEAKRLAGHQAVGSHHLLLAALGDPMSAAAKALGALGLDLDRAKDALRRVDVAGTTDELPEELGRRQMVVRLTDSALILETTDPTLMSSARAALAALDARDSSPAPVRAAPTTGVIDGAGECAESLADVWQAWQQSLQEIARTAAGHPQL